MRIALAWIIGVGAGVAFLILAGVISPARWRNRRRILRRYAVLGAFMTGNRIATNIAAALELDVRYVYTALADLEDRGWLTSTLDLPKPKPNDNRSPAVTATRETYGIQALRSIPDPSQEDDDA